jgi:hypothetical protein
MTSENGKRPTVVLVHGGFVDGSGWEGVYNVLRKDSFKVSVVQNPTISLADDVATPNALFPPRTVLWSSSAIRTAE